MRVVERSANACPNLLLLREPVETLGLDCIADEVTVHFPWGSHAEWRAGGGRERVRGDLPAAAVTAES